MKSPIPPPNPYGNHTPPPTNKPKPLWKKWWIWVIALVLIALTAFGARVFYLVSTVDERAEEARIEAASEEAAQKCTLNVAKLAKYPAAVEFPEPIEMTVSPVDQRTPTSATYSGFASGVVNFSNGFGVPTEYYYGCVSHHDEDGSLMRTQVDAREKTVFSFPFGYNVNDDELS